MNTDISIYNFLPKYPNIENYDYLDSYPDTSFNQSIFNKLEFDILEPFEDKPKIQGDLMKHQINVSRFLSNYTNQIIFFGQPPNDNPYTFASLAGKITSVTATVTGGSCSVFVSYNNGTQQTNWFLGDFGYPNARFLDFRVAIVRVDGNPDNCGSLPPTCP